MLPSTARLRHSRDFGETVRRGTRAGRPLLVVHLDRTPGGRWVLHRWSRWQGRPETHRFLTDDEAREWLLRSEINDGAVERYFGDQGDEAGPAPTGRPSMGDAPPITVKVPAELLARIDAAAGRAGIARAEWMRRACEAALS